MFKKYIYYLDYLDRNNLSRLASKLDIKLFKMADKLFEHIEQTAKDIASESQYDYDTHYNKLTNFNIGLAIPDIINVDTIKEYVRKKNEPLAMYAEMHPLIYIERDFDTNTWKYVIIDPKDLKYLEGGPSIEEKRTKIPLDEPIELVANHLHKIYPTALIDTELYKTLEEM